MKNNFFFWVFAAFAIGILCNEEFRPVLWMSVAGSCACLCGVILLRMRTGIVLALVAFFFLGMLYCRAACFLPQDHIFSVYKYEHYKKVLLQGSIEGDVKSSGFHGQKTFYFLADRMASEGKEWRPVCGKILVRLFHDVELVPGDCLKISGTLHKPHDFMIGHRMSYRTFLRQQEIFLVLTAGKKNELVRMKRRRGPGGRLLLFRERLKRIFDRHLPVFESAIMKAVLFGDRSGISRQTHEMFAMTGTAHILAISGLHMGIIVMIFLIVLGCLPIPLHGKYVLAVFFLAVYVFLAGGRASVLRSAIMVSVFLLSFIVERRFCSLNALGLAGFIILLIQPLALYRIGFQLSFLAVWSLCIFAHPVCSLLKARAPFFLNGVVQMFGVSLTAWLGVLGLVLYAFGMITPIGLVANLVAVTFMVVIIPLGLCLAAAGLLQAGWLAHVVAADLLVLIRWLIHFVAMMGHVPYGHFSGIEATQTQCLLYYIGLLMLAGIFRWRTLKRPPDVRRPF